MKKASLHIAFERGWLLAFFQNTPGPREDFKKKRDTLAGIPS